MRESDKRESDDERDKMGKTKKKGNRHGGICQTTVERKRGDSHYQRNHQIN